jgi:hypothetical protein
MEGKMKECLAIAAECKTAGTFVLLMSVVLKLMVAFS